MRYEWGMATPRLRKKTATLPLRADGTLRLSVVADTHSHPHPATEGHLRNQHPDAILHAGDIGDLDVLGGLASIAPLLAVRGNIDTRADTLPDVLTIDLVAHAGSTEPLLRILLVH